MLLGRDKHRCLLAILELLGHGRLWVTSVAFWNRSRPVDFHHAVAVQYVEGPFAEVVHVANSSSNALASFRSSVSKPSVNQP